MSFDRGDDGPKGGDEGPYGNRGGRRSRSYSPPTHHNRRSSRSRSPGAGHRRGYHGDRDRRGRSRSRSPYRRDRSPPRGPPRDYDRRGPFPSPDDFYHRYDGFPPHMYPPPPPHYRGGPPHMHPPPPPHFRGGPPPSRGGGRGFGPPFIPYGPRGGPGVFPRDRRAGGKDEGPPGVSLLVRNISNNITQRDLQLAFQRIGNIRDVYIPRDYHSQQPKGFAFIEFLTLREAVEAREEMDRFVLKGRELEVVFAQERRKTPDEMRTRDDNVPNANDGGGEGIRDNGGYERDRDGSERERDGGDRRHHSDRSP